MESEKNKKTSTLLHEVLKAHGNFKVCKARVQEVKIKKMEQ